MMWRASVVPLWISRGHLHWAGGVSESVFKCHALLSAGLLSVKWVYSERNSLVLYYISSVFQTVIQENNRIMMQTLIKYETSSDSGMKQLYRRWKSRYSDQLKFCSHLHLILSITTFFWIDLKIMLALVRIALAWLKSHLSDRYQFVASNEEMS